MSGGGGGGGPGFPEPGDPTPCEDLTFATALSDPIPGIIEGVGEGDVLAVELQSDPRRIAVVTGGGDVAGAIASQQFDRLLACLQSGHQYEAVVRSIDGGAVRVTVRPA